MRQLTSQLRKIKQDKERIDRQASCPATMSEVKSSEEPTFDLRQGRPLFQPFNFPQIICATSGRLGGVSLHPYQTLNMAYHVGDRAENVAENRKRLCNALGIDMDSLIVAQQVHGDNIEIVGETDAGRGAYRHEDAIPCTDGMITNSHMVTIAVLTADCVPVMVFDPVKKVIGIAHAGWKGTLHTIASKTVSKMGSAFGTRPADCVVFLGPSIGPCCYEVSEDIFLKFQQTFGPATCIRENRVDLKKAIELQLLGIGVEKRNILSNRMCTACNLDLFYSHRAENGLTGRMMSLIRLRT